MMRNPCSLIALLFLLTLASTSMSPELQAQQVDLPTFTSGTDLVEVPVIVQRSGKHVSGLKAGSFLLRQDGKEQPIATLEEIHLTGKASFRAGDPQPQSGKEPGAAQPQITVIAIDMVNTPNLDRAYFVEQFQRYLSKAGRLGGPVGLVAIERSGIRVLREFTTDARLLLAAISKDATVQPTANDDSTVMVRQLSDQAISESEVQLSNAPGMISVADALLLRSADESMVRFQDHSATLDTQSSIQQLAQALKGIPGRKSLLLVGSGFKFIDSTVVMKSIGGGGNEIKHSYEIGRTLDQAVYTWKLLNDANIAVYPIDTRRTFNPAFQAMDTSNGGMPSDLTFEQNRQADRDILDTFKAIAAATGGKPCFYRTDLDNCVREAVEDDRDYYLLGFYADKKNRQPGWHKIEVKLNDKASLRYRQGFIIANFNPEAVRKTDISLALSSPFAYTALPFSGKFDGFSEDKGKKVAKFSLFIPPNGIAADDSTGHIDFDVVAIARGDGGKEAARFNQHVSRNYPAQSIAEIKQTGINYGNRLELASGEYGVWFVVRDNISGRTGSAVVKLRVP